MEEITNQTEFKAREIKLLQNFLGLSNEERDLIFLHNIVIYNHVQTDYKTRKKG